MERLLIFVERLLVIVERLLIFVERPLAETSGLSTNYILGFFLFCDFLAYRLYGISCKPQTTVVNIFFCYPKLILSNACSSRL